jgi:3'-5' exoribonuclease
MKDIYIADLAGFEEGKLFDGYFLVLARQLATTKSNKPYLNLTLGDKTGSMEGRVWEPADPRIAKDFERGEIVKVRGSISRYNDRAQMKIDQLRLSQPTEAQKADMLPCTNYDVADLWRQLLGFVDSLANQDLNRLLTVLVEDPAIADAYREAPAAKQLHHAWLGGLLEHVISLCTLADRVVSHYPLIDRDLVITGVILHDIGKVRELSWEAGFEYTVEGMLLGHIHIGAALAERTMDALPDFPPRLKTIVLHMILSHHGKLEFGSPKVPMIPEALLLNFVDDLDAKMQAVSSEFDKSAREGKGPNELTNKVWALDNRQLLNAKRWLEDDKHGE